VVHLFHVEHLTYRQIADTMDVPIGTVMTWLHRARARLKASLAGTEVSP
jgi:RNA polymerase sigma-70 factor (ECF subfamily)